MESIKNINYSGLGNKLSKLAALALSLGLTTTTAGCKEEKVIVEQPKVTDTPSETNEPPVIPKTPTEDARTEETKTFETPAEIKGVISALCTNVFNSYPAVKQYLNVDGTETLYDACNGNIIDKSKIVCDNKQCIVYDGNMAYPVNYQVDHPKLDTVLRSYGYSISDDAALNIQSVNHQLNSIYHVPTTGQQLDESGALVICKPKYRLPVALTDDRDKQFAKTQDAGAPTTTYIAPPTPTPCTDCTVKSSAVEHMQGTMNYNDMLLKQ
jgi:hypothetical protein